MFRYSHMLTALALALFATAPVYAGLLDGVDKTLDKPSGVLQQNLPGKGGRILGVEEPLPNRFIVVLKQGRPLERTLNGLVKTYGGQPDLRFGQVLNGFATYMTSVQAKALSLDSAVKYVEQDAIQRTTQLGLPGLSSSSSDRDNDRSEKDRPSREPPARDKPAEPDARIQSNATWGLDRIDQADLPLNDNYSYRYTGQGVHAYIVDTGIRSDHTDFDGRLGNGVNTSDDPKQPPAGLLDPIFSTLFGDREDPDDPTADCNGHGTHVAGTTGGSEWGVAKGVTLHAVRVLNCDGAGSNSTVIAGLDWIAENVQRPAVVNMSLGGGASRAIDDAVNTLIDKGITVVVAAGNDNKDACESSPARARRAITVAASTKHDRRAEFSNHGRCADIFAPGKDITSAWIDSSRSTKTISGTSMASPHVAGAVALMLEENPNRSPADIDKLLEQQARRGKIGDRKGTPDKLLYIGRD